MIHKHAICAILAAAGNGSRLGRGSGEKPKQFLQLAGRPAYQWPLLALSRHAGIEFTIVTTAPTMVPAVAKEIELLGLGDKVIVTAGGSTRQESVRLGLEQLSQLAPRPELVIVHDAARPFLTGEIIDRTISAVKKHGACTAAIAAADTVKRLQGELVAETLDRRQLVLVQTPQAARFNWLLAAHEKARASGLAATDDAALLEAAGYKVAVVQGSSLNFKVTNAEDLLLCRAIAAIVLPGAAIEGKPGVC